MQDLRVFLLYIHYWNGNEECYRHKPVFSRNYAENYANYIFECDNVISTDIVDGDTGEVVTHKDKREGE